LDSQGNLVLKRATLGDGFAHRIAAFMRDREGHYNRDNTVGVERRRAALHALADHVASLRPEHQGLRAIQAAQIARGGGREGYAPGPSQELFIARVGLDEAVRSIEGLFEELVSAAVDDLAEHLREVRAEAQAKLAEGEKLIGQARRERQEIADVEADRAAYRERCREQEAQIAALTSEVEALRAAVFEEPEAEQPRDGSGRFVKAEV
jgi:hypothetical protein